MFWAIPTSMMKAFLVVLICVATCLGEEAKDEGRSQEKRGVEVVEDYGEQVHNGHAGAVSYSHVVQTHQHQQHHHPVRTYTLAKEVPYQVAIEKHVPVPVKIPVPVAIDRPYPVHIPRPIPIQVIKPVPYYVEKPVPIPVKVPVKVERPEYVLTKVPLVYHATYQDQQYYSNQGSPGQTHQYQPQQYQPQQHYQHYQPVVYERSYEEQH